MLGFFGGWDFSSPTFLPREREGGRKRDSDNLKGPSKDPIALNPKPYTLNFP